MNMMSERLLKRLEVMGMISSFDLSTSLAHGPGSSGSVDNIDCSFLHGVQVWEGQNRPFTIDDDLEKVE
jgi:hypothetical protein